MATTITLEPTLWILPDANDSTRCYGPWKTEHEAESYRKELGSRVNADQKPVGVLATKTRAPGGRKPGSKNAAPTTATNGVDKADTKPATKPSTLPGAKV